jgi:hypothetical protein
VRGYNLPFSAEAFLALFETYNLAIWPAQLVAYALGVLAVVLVFWPRGWTTRVIGAVLALFWLWMGVVYHGLYFTPINFLAPLFAALFVIQGLLLVWRLVVRGGITFRFQRDAIGYTAHGLMMFALIVYPLLSVAAEHAWPRMPAFGVAPCPTAIFTLGLLLLAQPKAPFSLMVVPLLWSLVGASSALLLRMPEDLSLPLAGVTALIVAIVKNRRAS